MQQAEFIERIRERIDLADEEIMSVVKATLETLADHMAGNAPAKLAAQLPAEIGEFITNHKSGETAEGEGFGVEEFLRRVGERAEIGETATVKLYASSVLAAVQDAVSRGEFDKVRGTFPAEYNQLFELESSEAMSTRY